MSNPINKQTNSEYYDSHWDEYADFNFPESKIERARKFFFPVSGQIEEYSKILDVGIGDGVHFNFLNKTSKVDNSYMGVDVSFRALQLMHTMIGAKKLSNNFVQMDACNLGYADHSFDFVFAYGVIGYSENWRKALGELVRVCKPGKFIGVFSPEIRGFYRIALWVIRLICMPFGFEGKKRIANFLIPFYSRVSKDSGVNLSNTTKRKVEEGVLTNIAPPRLVIIDHQSLIDLFVELNCTVIYDDKDHRSTIWAAKR